MLMNIIVYFACVALLLLRCVLLGLTVYYDARAKNIKDATKWSVVAAVGGLIGCLFYVFLARRKSTPMRRCTVCGALLPAGSDVCLRCKAQGSFQVDVAEPALFARRSKTMLVSWLIATAMAALILLFFLVAVFSARFSYHIEEKITDYATQQEAPSEFFVEEMPWITPGEPGTTEAG